MRISKSRKKNVNRRKIRTPEENEDLRQQLEDPKQLNKLIKKFLIPKIRKASLHWLGRTIALANARVAPGLYKCYICSLEFGIKDIHADHIDPIVSVTGFTDWNDYILKTLVSPSKYGVACITCHEAKTMVEKERRKLERKKKKNVSKS